MYLVECHRNPSVTVILAGKGRGGVVDLGIIFNGASP